MPDPASPKTYRIRRAASYLVVPRRVNARSGQLSQRAGFCEIPVGRTVPSDAFSNVRWPNGRASRIRRRTVRRSPRALVVGARGACGVGGPARRLRGAVEVGRGADPERRGARRARREDREAVGRSSPCRDGRGARAELALAARADRRPARADQGDARADRRAVADARADAADGDRRCRRAAAGGGRGPDPAAEGDREPRHRASDAARPRPLGRGSAAACGRARRDGRVLRLRRAGQRARQTRVGSCGRTWS